MTRLEIILCAACLAVAAAVLALIAAALHTV